MFEQIDEYIRRMVDESTPQRTVWNIESIRQGKKTGWNYIDGCMITALLSMADITGDRRYFDFAENFIDWFILEDGTIRDFKADSPNLDDINEGRVLFRLYQETGKKKYRMAADFLMKCLRRHPRTCEGSFWHKEIYPNQVWLDGIYMAQPFYVLYEKIFGKGDYSDTIRQVETVRDRMLFAQTGLYYHGYDASRRAFWADPVTGCSKSFWLRAIGWFSAALADLIELLPEGAERNKLIGIFADLMDNISRYADSETGMYWQVVDQGGREGNYLETSGSCLIAYAMLKGSRIGVIGKEYADKGAKTFTGIVDKKLSYENGELTLGGICLVAGLGPENNRRRDGSYEYYISEPVVANDAKGAAPMVLCYTEVIRLARQA